MKYRAVFIDWDDTLGDWRGSAEEAQRVLFDKHINPLLTAAGVVVPFEDYLAYYRAHNTELWERYATGDITREYLHLDQFLNPVCHYLGIPTEAAGQDLIHLCNGLGTDYIELTLDNSRLTPDAKEVVEYLAKKYILTIVSNGFVEMQYLKLRRSGLQPFVKHTVFSEEVGVMKPDPRIMEIAIARNEPDLPNLQPDEVVMIGDSFSSDIAGAVAAGIDTIWWVRPETTPTREQEEKATYVVHSLKEVMTIL